MMQDFVKSYWDTFNSAFGFLQKFSKNTPDMIQAFFDQAKAIQAYWGGVWKYYSDFMAPSWNAQNSFLATEDAKLKHTPPLENLRDYEELLRFNLDIGRKGLFSGIRAVNEYSFQKVVDGHAAFLAMFSNGNGEDYAKLASRQVGALTALVNEYPKAIKAIQSEYGFHFDNGGYVKTAETDRFVMYQVLPTDANVRVRENGKPVLIIPPYVLGANILAFLPGENRSYVHCFADQGIPTYIRIVKDIDNTPAVQLMTGEDDALDTRFFCEKLTEVHQSMVTLNGFCQGGYVAATNLLSGELDGLVDALITCATPMDGTRSKGLIDYMNRLPARFRDIGYSIKTLPNGNQVVDGEIMGWVYKLKSMESESPVAAFHRDLKMFEGLSGPAVRINKVAAAINHWMIYDRTDLPLAITRMSFESYTVPISKDGILPVKLFGRELNLKRLSEKGIRYLICIAANDDLVDKEAALAPLNYIDAEVTVFPKGHASIATSWTIPTSQCALHKCFANACLPTPDGKGSYRGPVRFHMDLEENGTDLGGSKAAAGCDAADAVHS